MNKIDNKGFFIDPEVFVIDCKKVLSVSLLIATDGIFWYWGCIFISKRSGIRIIPSNYRNKHGSKRLALNSAKRRALRWILIR